MKGVPKSEFGDLKPHQRSQCGPFRNGVFLYFASEDYWDEWDRLENHRGERTQPNRVRALTSEVSDPQTETSPWALTSAPSHPECIAVQPKPKPPIPPQPSRLRRLGWAVPLLLASLFFWQGFSGEGQAVTPSVAQPQQAALKTTPIRELQTGMRVIGDNPELADQQIDPLQITDPSRWRNVRLEMSKADGSLLKITLLRPVEWLDFQEAEVGSVIELDLPELGAAGPAQVLAIEPCPDIEPGNRPLITGTFEHTAANVIDLEIESEAAPIGTTDNHPFWSEDRQEFVEAGELKIGETLSLADGRTTRVTSIIPRAGPETVYNLEVSGEHVYHVGNSGVLVHNTYNADEFVTVYHGTSTKGAKSIRANGIKLSKGRSDLDFGPKAFYTTTDEALARQWAGADGEVLAFRVRKSDLSNLGYKQFDDVNPEWQGFVTRNRLGEGHVFPNHDVVNGPILSNPGKLKSVTDFNKAAGFGNQQGWLTQQAINLLKLID